MKTLLARLQTRLNTPWADTRWHEVHLDPKHEVTCSCGGNFTDLPDEFDFTIGKGACAHIVALYTGVTDWWCCQFTETGEAMFQWRWVALALAE